MRNFKTLDYDQFMAKVKKEIDPNNHMAFEVAFDCYWGDENSQNDGLFIFKHRLPDKLCGCAWITDKGQVVHVDYGGHEAYARIFLGSSEGVVEQHMAKITFSSTSYYDAIAYVEPKNVTEEMKRSIIKHMGKYERFKSVGRRWNSRYY